LLGFDEAQDGRRSGSRPSKFELAQGGTLFFQDVDALPLEGQAVLLNALEAGMIQRMGNRRPIAIDVRVIASTSATMETLIAQGSFRPDLFYWLSTFSITLQPMRERPRDIPMVVERILKRLASQWGLSNLELASGVMDVLKRQPWPGNIREIEAVLGRAATQVGPNGLIMLNMLPAGMRNTATDADRLAVPVRPMLELERQAILQAAQQCQGNVTQMAQTLEISRTTLWRRMREFGIQPKDFRS
jgi:transcriptional activator for dhaKLM operon